jgi:hypothetical protein
VGDERQDGWLAPLKTALFPCKKIFRAARMCKWFRGNATILDRALHVPEDKDPSLKPGFHKPASGDHSVLSWDPAALDLNVPENFVLKQVQLLKTEGASEQSLKEYQAWRAGRREIVTIAASPSVEVIRITDLNDEPPPAPVAIHRVDGDSFRSGAVSSARSSTPSFGMHHGIRTRTVWHAWRHACTSYGCYSPRGARFCRRSSADRG